MAKIIVRNNRKTTPPTAPRARLMWWIAGGLTLILIAAGVYMTSRGRAITPAAPSEATETTAPQEPTETTAPSGERDYGVSQLSEQGLFRIWYTAEEIQINQMHEWIIHVETADGEPVENAQITVDGGMPDHGHGLPTVPQVTDYLGDGNYRVEGLRFQMQGLWVVTFHIDADGVTDTVTFNLTL
jgi:hypothetical protein